MQLQVFFVSKYAAHTMGIFIRQQQTDKSCYIKKHLLFNQSLIASINLTNLYNCQIDHDFLILN